MPDGRISSQLQSVLGRLTEDQRAVIVLRHFVECSYRQIGEILQIPEKTVKSRLFSARRLLAEALGDLRTRRAAGGRRT